MAHGNSNAMRHFLRSYFPGWQVPFMAQPAHPQPQDDFPFLLLRTMLAIDTATARSRIALMMIVAIFSIIHVSIGIPPVFMILPASLSRRFQFHVCGQLCRLFIRSKQHIDHAAKDDDSS